MSPFDIFSKYGEEKSEVQGEMIFTLFYLFVFDQCMFQEGEDSNTGDEETQATQVCQKSPHIQLLYSANTSKYIPD